MLHRDDPPSQLTLQLIAGLSAVDPASLEPVNPVKEFGLRDIDLVEQFRKLQELKMVLETFQCVQCNSFKDHVSLIDCCILKLLSDCILSAKIYIFIVNTVELSTTDLLIAVKAQLQICMLVFVQLYTFV